jgi:hypothetical protein
MTDTLLSSPTKEVRIGFDRPFVVIGERINPTGRKILSEEMKVGDYSRVEADALAQVEAGAHMLDVNAGIPLADEPAILAEAIQLVQSVTDVPLSIDSSIVAALESGLAVYQGKALVNSVTGEEERLETVLPLVAKYKAAVVAISNDETGISEGFTSEEEEKARTPFVIYPERFYRQIGEWILEQHRSALEDDGADGQAVPEVEVGAVVDQKECGDEEQHRSREERSFQHIHVSRRLWHFPKGYYLIRSHVEREGEGG